MIDVFLNFFAWMVKNPVKGFILLFIEYVGLMALCAKVKPTTTFRKALMLLPVALFAIHDWIVNVFAMSVLMLDPPGKAFEVVTARMKRYKILYSGRDQSLSKKERWRLLFANALCKQLNKYDPTGFHC